MASLRMARKVPVVVVLGCTGSGKSKLALEIAAKFNGEIISADSMQVYKGLDIITNKVTLEEQAIAKHHLIDFISPLCKDYNITDFKRAALPIIDNLLTENKVPIIVGGTNYYIESLLWNNLIEKKSATEGNSSADGKTDWVPSKSYYPDLSTEDLYKKLREVDLAGSRRIHPKDRRKILRSLQVFKEQGVPLSQLLKQQHEGEGDQAVSGPLRYQNPCVFWLQCDKEVLEERTNKRVDEMIERGLITELEDFHKSYNAARLETNSEPAYTEGIFQSIGFKEFHDYLILSDEDKAAALGQALFKVGADETKMITRRYAKKQTTWFRSRFLRRQGSAVPDVYQLDTSNPSNWNNDVKGPAFSILQAFLEEKTPDIEPVPREEKIHRREYNTCEICNKVFINTREYDAHMEGRKHRNRFFQLKRKAKLEEAARQEQLEPSGGEATEQNPPEENKTTTADPPHKKLKESEPQQDSAQ